MKNILFLVILHPWFAVYNSKGVQKTHVSYFPVWVQVLTYHIHLINGTYWSIYKYFTEKKIEIFYLLVILQPDFCFLSVFFTHRSQMVIKIPVALLQAIYTGLMLTFKFGICLLWAHLLGFIRTKWPEILFFFQSTTAFTPL